MKLGWNLVKASKCKTEGITACAFECVLVFRVCNLFFRETGIPAPCK